MTKVFLALVVASVLGINCKQHTQAFSLPALQPKTPVEIQAEYDVTQTKYAELQARVTKNAADADALAQLAQLFVTEARASGDHHYYYPAALRIADEALRVQPANFMATAVKASLLMTFHRFADAKALIAPAVSTNPYNAFASCVLIDALVELGEYDLAIIHCDSLLQLKPGLPSYARASYLRELHGDREGARQVMRLAVDAGVGGHEDRAWALHQYANLYLQSGMIDTAEFLYNGLLQERPNYPPALMGLANVRVAQHNLAGAIELAAQAVAITRDHLPLEQLASLYRASGNAAAADTLGEQVLVSMKQHEREGWDIDREYAQFCADNDMHLGDALDRAKREYDRRPENIDAEQTYAWVLTKLHRPNDALPIIDHALRLHSTSPMLLFVAGMIHASVHDAPRALALLDEASGSTMCLAPQFRDQARAALADLRAAQ